jgi:hypothetical protein
VGLCKDCGANLDGAASHPAAVCIGNLRAGLAWFATWVIENQGATSDPDGWIRRAKEMGVEIAAATDQMVKALNDRADETEKLIQAVSSGATHLITQPEFIAWVHKCGGLGPPSELDLLNSLIAEGVRRHFGLGLCRGCGAETNGTTPMCQDCAPAAGRTQ